MEQSSLSIRRTLAPIGIPRSTFYDCYSRYQEGGIEALEDGKPRPRRIWNKIPDKIRTAIVNLALEESDLSPRELAVNFTDTNGSFVSEASVYRLLKDHGLITSPAFSISACSDVIGRRVSTNARSSTSRSPAGAHLPGLSARWRRGCRSSHWPSRPTRVAGSCGTPLPSSSARPQQGGEQDYQSAGDDQEQYELEQWRFTPPQDLEDVAADAPSTRESRK